MFGLHITIKAGIPLLKGHPTEIACLTISRHNPAGSSTHNLFNYWASLGSLFTTNYLDVIVLLVTSSISC